MLLVAALGDHDTSRHVHGMAQELTIQRSPTSTFGLTLPGPHCDGNNSSVGKSYSSSASSPLLLLKLAGAGLRPRSSSSLDTDAEDSPWESNPDENHNVPTSTKCSPPTTKRPSLRRCLKCPQAFIILLILTIVSFHCVLLVFMPNVDNINTKNQQLTEPQGSLRKFGITDIKTLQLNPQQVAIIDCDGTHIPQCPTSSCLRTLEVDHHQMSVTLPRNSVFSAHLQSEIKYMPGYVHSLHMDIIPALSDMQWQHDIYGSLGEMKPHLGKFTAILAFNYDQEAGERLFVMDNFSETLSSRTEDSDTHLAHLFSLLRNRGFAINTLDPTLKQVLLQDTSHQSIDGSLLRNLNLPQFRMLSIGALRNPSELVSILEQCLCVMRDGGILVIDGVHLSKTRDPVTAIIGKFLRTHPSFEFMPFLVAQNKLYLCNTRWRNVYSKYLLTNHNHLQTLNIQGVTNNLFGVQYTYFIIA
ncbi:hypothetical protein CAPTEDRAFT_218471 [Capitella teleta]|uniref:Methyltransferase domain-containing protein n=1 Tax=Capitella teleta TaxID=283909 RepID=R7VIT4_CAPTE|nr:hypothetical protein CAPTEDRAFT_218471 [Capitella teleta]|eukprot:ELU18743.1 hypothetical protein CAPTEDRAFT_218471 [Capitella teleta]